MNRALFFCCTALLVLCLPSALIAGTEEDLAGLREIYTEHLDKMTTDYTAKAGAWPEEYTKALRGLLEKTQNAGLLDDWSLIKREIERFQATPELSEKHAVAAPKELSTIQAKYRNILLGYSIEKNRQIISLTRMYLSRLGDMQKELTKSGRIKDALKVNAELKQVKATPQVTAAEFEIAEYEAEKRKAKRQAQKAVEPVPAPPKDEETGDAQQDVQPENAETDYRIYTDVSPPSLPDFKFKKLSLRSTDRMRVGHKVSVNLLLGTQSDVSKTRHIDSWWRTKTKGGAMTHFARIALRSTSTKQELTDAKLVVQYFGKELSDTSSKVEPQDIAVAVVPLPPIRTKWVHVDCTPVSTYAYSREHRSWSYRSSSKAGQHFYGLVISVFDADDSLCYQGASTGTLQKLGLAKLPQNTEEERIRRDFRQKRDAYDVVRKAYHASMGDDSLRRAYETAREEYERARRAYRDAGFEE